MSEKITKIREQVLKLKPYDDILFEKLMEDIEVCQEILRVILEDDELVVESVVPQNSIKNLQGRSVCLDALCVLKDGTRCNVEVQKADNDSHIRRTRYHAACITANITDPGERFENVPNVCIVYISAFDLLKKKKTIYHVESIVREIGDVLDNGLTIIFVNTEIYDGTNISELMKCFTQEIVKDEKFPALSKRVSYFKEEQKGADTMCSIIEDIVNEEKKEMILKHRARGVAYAIVAESSGLTVEQIRQIEEAALQMA